MRGRRFRRASLTAGTGDRRGPKRTYAFHWRYRWSIKRKRDGVGAPLDVAGKRVGVVSVDPESLRLPVSPIARPGERVRWFAGAKSMSGVVRGHNAAGEAVIENAFGATETLNFEDVRLEEPFQRGLPNWHSLPQDGRLLRPGAEVLERFRAVMRSIIPPGVTYQELAEEIWGRGFEVFLVGGTVRDVLAGKHANDVDLVTTMPLGRMRGFLQKMFRSREKGHAQKGYIRLGGRPATGDPFIDLKVFSAGGDLFGGGFEHDIRCRDFVCNAVYYDPINEIIVDPTGQGVADCAASTLRLVGEHDRFQQGQIFIRAVKFIGRGFEPHEQTQGRLVTIYLPSLNAMTRAAKIGYFRTQVLSKHPDLEAKMQAVLLFKESLHGLGCSSAWDTYFGFGEEELRDG